MQLLSYRRSNVGIPAVGTRAMLFPQLGLPLAASTAFDIAMLPFYLEDVRSGESRPAHRASPSSSGPGHRPFTAVTRVPSVGEASPPYPRL